jgi:hypothetical protein
MNKKIKFYELLLAFVNRKGKEDIVAAHEMKVQLIALAKECSNPWVITESDLDQMDLWSFWNGDHCHRRFMLSAFKDLSAFRHPKAARIFQSLKSQGTGLEIEFIWASKTITRVGGQQISILHISSPKVWGMLRRLYKKEKFGDGDLSEGMVLEGSSEGAVFIV